MQEYNFRGLKSLDSDEKIDTSLQNDVKYSALNLAFDVAKEETAYTENTKLPENRDIFLDKIGEQITGDNPLVRRFNNLYNNLPNSFLQSELRELTRDIDDFSKKVKIAEKFYEDNKLKPLEEEKLYKEGLDAITEYWNITREHIANNIRAVETLGDPALLSNKHGQFFELENLEGEEKKKRQKQILDDLLFNRRLLQTREGNIYTSAGIGELTKGVTGLAGSFYGYAEEGVKRYSPFVLPLATMGASYLEGKGEVLLNLYEDGVDVINDEKAQKIATVGGALYASLEKLQLDKVFPGAKRVAGKTLAQIIKRGLAEYGKDVAENTLQEGLQAVTIKMSEDIAKMKNAGLTDKQVIEMLTNNPDRYWNEFKSQLETAGAFAVVGLPGKAMNVASSVKKISGVGAQEQNLLTNIEEAKEVLNKAGFNGEEVVKVVDEIKTEAGVKASGKVEKGIISLAKIATNDKAGLHEAFHFLAKEFGGTEEYQSALNEVMRREGTTKENAEEILADEFANWVKNRNQSSKLGKIFGNIFDNIKSIFGKNQETLKLFRAIEEGKFQKQPEVKEQQAEQQAEAEPVYKREMSEEEEERLKEKLMMKEEQKPKIEKLEKIIVNPQMLREKGKEEKVLKYLIEQKRIPEAKEIIKRFPETYLGDPELSQLAYEVLENEDLNKVVEREYQKEKERGGERTKKQIKRDIILENKMLMESLKRTKELGELKGAITERYRQTPKIEKLEEALIKQKEKAEIAERTAGLKGAILGRMTGYKEGYRKGKKETQLKAKYNKLLGKARLYIYTTIRDLKKRLKNNSLSVDFAELILERLAQYFEVGLMRNIMSIQAEYAIKTQDYSIPERIDIRSDGSIWGEITDNRIKKQELLKIINKLSDDELFNLYNEISYLHELGKIDRERQLEFFKESINKEITILTSSINESAKVDAFSVYETAELKEHYEKQKVKQSMRVITNSEGVLEVEEGKIPLIKIVSNLFNKFRKKTGNAFLNPFTALKLIDNRSNYLYNLLWSNLVPAEKKRDDIIKRTRKIWADAYIELSKKYNMEGEYTKFIDEEAKVEVSYNRLQMIMISIYMANDFSRYILMNNNTNPALVSSHNRLTPKIALAINEKVEQDNDMRYLRNKILEAVNANTEDMIRVAKESNILMTPQEFYMSYILERTAEEGEDIHNFADSITEITEEREFRRRVSKKHMTKERQRHTHPIKIKDVNFKNLIDRTIESQARFISYEPIYKKITAIVRGIKPILVKKYNSEYAWNFINNWLEDVIFGEYFGVNPIESGLRWLRKTTYSAKLWLNLKTILRQSTATFVAMSMVGVKPIMKGLKSVNNKQKWKMAFEKSQVLSTRLVNYDQADFEKYVEGRKDAHIITFGLKGLTLSDAYIATAVWLGVYEDYISEKLSKPIDEGEMKTIEEKAIILADQTVAHTQNMSSVLFKPEAVRNSELMKNVFMYGSQGFQIYSLAQEYKYLLKFKKIRPLEYLWKLLLLIWIPAFFNRMIDTGRLPFSDKDELPKETVDFLVGGYAERSPILNKIWGAIEYDKSLTESASLGFSADLLNASKKILQGELPSAGRYAVMGLGQLTGYNTHAIDTAILGSIDIITGEDKRFRRLIWRKEAMGLRLEEADTPKEIKSIYRKKKEKILGKEKQQRLTPEQREKLRNLQQRVRQQYTKVRR